MTNDAYLEIPQCGVDGRRVSPKAARCAVTKGIRGAASPIMMPGIPELETCPSRALYTYISSEEPVIIYTIDAIIGTKFMFVFHQDYILLIFPTHLRLTICCMRDKTIRAYNYVSFLRIPF